MSHQEEIQAFTPIAVRLTQTQITAMQTAGTLPPAGVDIHVVDGSGNFVEKRESTGATSQPASGGGGGSAGSLPAWLPNTPYDAGAVVRATAVVGAIGIGDLIQRNAVGTSGPTFNAGEIANWTELPEDPDTIAALNLKAPLVSPALTGIPTVPTAAVGTNTTQAASTAFVQAEIAADLATATPLVDGVAAVGTSVKMSREDHVHPIDTSRAPTASPTLTGTVVADGTVRLGDGQNVGDSGTAVASGTTAFTPAASTAGTTISTADTALRLCRPGTSGSKWGNVLDLNLGSHTAGLNSQTQVELRLNNGGQATPDMTILTLKANGEILLNSNPTAALGAVTKQYADALVAGLLEYRGAFTPAVSSGTTGYPTTGGSGSAGAILKGDTFVATADGFVRNVAIQTGDWVVAKNDTPAQVANNWDILNTNISFAPEDSANKVTSLSAASTDTQYPSAKATFDAVAVSTAVAKAGKQGTIHHAATTVLAITEALHAGVEIHLENTGELTLAASAVTTDNFGFSVLNTDSGVTRTLTPSGFAGVFLRDGNAAGVDLGNVAFNIGENAAYEFTVTINGVSKYLNIFSLNREELKTINGQEIRGTGNLAVGASAASVTTRTGGTGGTITAVGNDRVHVFNASDNFVVPAGVTSVRVLAIGGGGGGGTGRYRGDTDGRPGGGGGAGGLIHNTAFAVTPGATIPVTIGAGGAGATDTTDADVGVRGAIGGNTTFSTLVAHGGGGGGGHKAVVGSGWDTAPTQGGSGGGASNGGTGATQSAAAAAAGNTGNSGGTSGVIANGGGGGGAGGAGAGGGTGGVGLANTITGAAVTYAAGGNGSTLVGGAGAAGTANRGNGGAGASESGSDGPAAGSSPGGSGGSGIVIVRYLYQSLDTPVFANNAAAITGGLTLGALYRTGADPDTLCVVH